MKQKLCNAHNEKSDVERMAIEETLEHSQVRLKALSEAPFEAIFLSEKGVCFDQNQAAKRMFGYTRAEAVGRYGTEWISPEDREQVKNNIQSGYEKPYEVTALRKDGTTFICEIQARMIDYEGRPIRVTALRDITERKQAEKALQNSEQKLNSIVAHVGVGIVIIRDGQMVYSNARILEMLGYSEEESAGLDFLSLVHPEDRDFAVERIRQRLTNETPDSHLTHMRVLTKSGDTKWIETSSVRIQWQNEPAIQAWLIDITKRKHAEQALQQAHNELEQRVKDRTKALEIQKRSLEEANTALTVLLRKRDEDKNEIEKKVLHNIKELVEPCLEKLKKSGLNKRQMNFVSALESNIKEIISSFSYQLSSSYLHLTPMELQVANLVKHGKSTKEIAGFLNLSSKTIESHRKKLRKKLNLTNTETNLRTYLLSFPF
jgi:PAS domain S-box-containing protein